MCLVLGDPLGAALAFDAGFVVLHEGIGGGVEGLAFGLEEPGPALAAQFEIPVFGDLLGMGQAIGFGAFPAVLALQEGRAKPVLAPVVAAIELHLAVEDGMRRHKTPSSAPLPGPAPAGRRGWVRNG